MGSTQADPAAVTVTRVEAQAADKELGDRVEAEVRAQLEKDRSEAMSADHKATLEAAHTQIKELIARLETETKARTAEVKRLEELEACAKTQRLEAEGRQKDAEAVLARDAREVAVARGIPADRLEAEVKRIAALGRAAVTELLESTPAPSADPLVLRRLETTDGKKSPIERLVTRGESGSDVRGYVIADWAAFGKAVQA